MRHMLWCLLLTLATVGCHSDASAPSPPLTPDQPGTPALGGAAVTGDLLQSAVGIFTLTIDPISLQASTALEATRAAQANDDLYLLPVTNFMTPATFQVLSVASEGSNLTVRWRFQHPIAAPSDPGGAPSATNRADLGFAGMALLLLDAPSASGNTYFSTVVANTDLCPAPDGYFQPYGLLDLPGYTANCFPFVQLVDEREDSREGVSNLGSAVGNYGSLGWTRAKLGAAAPFNKWTGFGVLHQGQASINTFTFDRIAMAAAGPIDFRVAFIAKYADPRQGTTQEAQRANRLPPSLPDATKFAYRMPHGAPDVQRLQFLGEVGGLRANMASSTTLRFHLEDWDARATASTFSDLSQEPDVHKVAINEAGLPDMAVCIPGLRGGVSDSESFNIPQDVLADDSAVGGDVVEDSGEPMDALYYAHTLDQPVLTNQTPGVFTGMARSRDQEPVALMLPLDADLIPVAAPPANTTFTAFQVTLGEPDLPPVIANVAVQTPVSDGGTLTITMSGIDDPELQDITVEADWDDNGSFTVCSPVLTAPYPASQQFISPITYVKGVADPDMRDLPIRYRDTAGNEVTVSPLRTFEVRACVASNIIFNANFESQVGDNAWIGGHNFDPPLNNHDGNRVQGDRGTSYWRASEIMYCDKYILHTVLDQHILCTGWDTPTDFCPIEDCTCYPDDYQTNVDNNVVSPRIDLTGKTRAFLRFDSVVDAPFSDFPRWLIYMSIDDGQSWGTPIWDKADYELSIDGRDRDILLELPAWVLGQSQCRLRFQFTAEGFDAYDVMDGWANAGWAIDRVRVNACP